MPRSSSGRVPRPSSNTDPSAKSETQMWKDTLSLLHSLFDNLPGGAFGAIMRLAGAAMVLCSLLAVLSMIITRRTDIVMQLVIMMFLAFMTSVIVYVVRPPDDQNLARGQARRTRQIAPRPIIPSEGASS